MSMMINSILEGALCEEKQKQVLNLLERNEPRVEFTV